MKNAITIGVDLGDKNHIAVVFDAQGNELHVARVTNTRAGVAKFFKHYPKSTVEVSIIVPYTSNAGKIAITLSSIR